MLLLVCVLLVCVFVSEILFKQTNDIINIHLMEFSLTRLHKDMSSKMKVNTSKVSSQINTSKP